MKSLILLLLLNQPDGSQLEIALLRNLDAATCNRMAAEIWSAPQEIIGHDEYGPIPNIDAACVYPIQLSAND